MTDKKFTNVVQNAKSVFHTRKPSMTCYLFHTNTIEIRPFLTDYFKTEDKTVAAHFSDEFLFAGVQNSCVTTKRTKQA